MTLLPHDPPRGLASLAGGLRAGEIPRHTHLSEHLHRACNRLPRPLSLLPNPQNPSVRQEAPGQIRQRADLPLDARGFKDLELRPVQVRRRPAQKSLGEDPPSPGFAPTIALSAGDRDRPPTLALGFRHIASGEARFRDEHKKRPETLLRLQPFGRAHSLTEQNQALLKLPRHHEKATEEAACEIHAERVPDPLADGQRPTR